MKELPWPSGLATEGLRDAGLGLLGFHVLFLSARSLPSFTKKVHTRHEATAVEFVGTAWHQVSTQKATVVTALSPPQPLPASGSPLTPFSTLHFPPFSPVHHFYPSPPPPELCLGLDWQEGFRSERGDGRRTRG